MFSRKSKRMDKQHQKTSTASLSIVLLWILKFWHWEEKNHINAFVRRLSDSWQNVFENLPPHQFQGCYVDDLNSWPCEWCRKRINEEAAYPTPFSSTAHVRLACVAEAERRGKWGVIISVRANTSGIPPCEFPTESTPEPGFFII